MMATNLHSFLPNTIRHPLTKTTTTTTSTSKALLPSIPLPRTATKLPLQTASRTLLTSCSSSRQEIDDCRPPSSREEAISQAKQCLAATLQKPLNNPAPLAARKVKKLRQPRYRVEIPVVDDSPASIALLAADVFGSLPVKKKGARPSTLVLWATPALAESARDAFKSAKSVVNSDLAAVTTDSLGSADLAVFSAPEASQLEDIRTVADALYPKPVVLFNPKWGFDEEKDIAGDMGGFLGSFDVVYSFMGLEVRGVLSKRKGVVLRSARDGVLSGEAWVVMVEDDGNKGGELRVVSRFKRRPSIAEVESVLYNLMAANSPVTKSVKFLGDLVSNVTGRKQKKLRATMRAFTFMTITLSTALITGCQYFIFVDINMMAPY